MNTAKTISMGLMIIGGLACQAPDYQNQRLRSHGQSTVDLSISAGELALTTIAATNVAGVMSCAGTDEAFMGNAATLSAAMLNAGDCAIEITSFNLAATPFTKVADGATPIPWSVNSIHEFQNPLGATLALRVVTQLPKILNGGENYSVAFQIYQNREAGSRAAIRDAIANASDANVTVALEEAPSIALREVFMEVIEGVPTYTLRFDCSNAYDPANHVCDGRALDTDLKVMATDQQLDHYPAAAYTSYLGDAIGEIRSGDAANLFLTVNASRSYTTPEVEKTITFTATGFDVTIGYAGSADLLSLYMIYFNPADASAPISSATVGSVEL